MTKPERQCKTMADVCELAHARTVRECKKKKIRVDCVSKFKDGECVIHDNTDMHYTTRAQDIFDKHYNHICEVTGI